jgi:hypothetical protein
MTRAIPLALFSLALGAVSCGEQRPPPASFSTDAGGPSSSDAGTVFGSKDPWAAVPACAQETQYVYVIDSAGVLRRFDPPTLAFTRIGPLECDGSPYSMAVDRTAVAWVLFTNGRIARVDTRTGKCKPTSFTSPQNGFSAPFGMGFSTNGDADAGAGESLFVSAKGLATIDTQSLEIRPIGVYDTLRGKAELTGTGDGRLFGAFEGTSAQDPYVIAELDKTTARPLSQVPQPAITTNPTGGSLAFAFWGGDFFVFEGPGRFSDVFRYRPSDGTTTKVARVDYEIVGAGVSTCAPTTGPR